MFEQSVDLRFGDRPGAYRVTSGYRILDDVGGWAAGCLGGACKAAIVSNERIHGLYGDRVENALRSSGFEVATFLTGDGERHKNIGTVADLTDFLSERRITRADAVVALGGGVVGDIAGFSSSIHLRGLRYLQVPTTLLSMIDASVGGKTGVNTRHGKNLVGAFHQPAGVFADVETLNTLDPRELRSGFYEAVKQGALSGGDLLGRTGEIVKGISDYPPDEDPVESLGAESFCALLADHVRFKAGIVAQDAAENMERTDPRSRKVLNFGHTTAHALEKITEYGYFRHGEAVAYGMLVAGEISRKLEICGEDGIKLLNDVVRTVGDLPSAGSIPVDKVIELFKADKKSTGEYVHWVLLAGIGEPVIVSGQKIPRSVIKESLSGILSE